MDVSKAPTSLALGIIMLKAMIRNAAITSSDRSMPKISRKFSFFAFTLPLPSVDLQRPA